ncbi:MAG: FHA domain-containing protein [Planctomycetes bacterium]|nr:FHA domain-containing protein [Planctomycetota bacterium]
MPESAPIFVPLPDLREQLESIGEAEFTRTVLVNRPVLLYATPEGTGSEETVSTAEVFKDSKSASGDPSSWYQNTAAILRTRFSQSDEVRVGRHPKCDLLLVLQGVSQDHALLRETPQGWTVTDLGSKHGTFVNDERLEAEESRSLGDGDTVRFGPYLPLTLTFPAALLRLIDPGA